MNPYDVETFEEFWPHYVRMHSNRQNQRVHAVASITAITMVSVGVLRGNVLLVCAAPLADHLIAQLGHRLFQHNKTSPWKNPLWHARAEWRMLRRVLTGRTLEA